MNSQVLEILTEESSMEIFLREILPKILPEDYQLDVNCFIRPHEGKSHLKKIYSHKNEGLSPVSLSCKSSYCTRSGFKRLPNSKKDLQALCNSDIPVVIRIACRELENWYLGDFQAIEAVYPEIKAAKFEKKAKYRNPDIVFGSKELEGITKNFSKSYAAREIPRYMNINNNQSASFQHLILGLKKLISPDTVQ
ncbi:MAG: DUF4276 family protein [Bacteroidia bacterium]